MKKIELIIYDVLERFGSQGALGRLLTRFFNLKLHRAMSMLKIGLLFRILNKRSNGHGRLSAGIMYPFFLFAQMGRTRGIIFNSIEILQTILSIAPGHVGASLALAEIYYDIGEISTAKVYFDNLLENERNRTQHFDFDKFKTRLSLEVLDPAGTNQTIYREATQLAQHVWRPKSRHPDINSQPKSSPTLQKKVNIGFNCSFWDAYGLELFFFPIIKQIDRSAFNLFFFGPSVGQGDNGSYTFRDTARLDDLQYTRLLQADDIHILIDLDGHIPGTRFKAIAQKIAPVQVCYFNYASTSGVRTFDYFLADPEIVPPNNDCYYSEKIFRLDCPLYTFKKPNHWPKPTPSPFRRNGYVIFGFFGNPIKLNSKVLNCWAMILNSVARSRLLIIGPKFGFSDFKQQITNRMLRAGFKADQLIFHKGMEHADLLAVYGEVDLILDPFPYNGGHTMVEALLLGVPLISLTGDRFVSRVGRSILGYANLGELIADSEDIYLEKYISLANNPERLSLLRHTIVETITDSPVCNTEAAARAWESAFQSMSDPA